MHGIISNAGTEISGAELLASYRDLWQIEEAFKVQKHNLRFRPVYHLSAKRKRAHIAICYLAFAVAKQALYRLRLRQAPMSFAAIQKE
ncbi:Transposase [Candidatus Magnetoovum chiemensis]|nr:Transposase [Candidatus Magnetoovum chiemensis]